MPRQPKKTPTAKNSTGRTLTLADQLFAITTRNYTNPTADFLPQTTATSKKAITDFMQTNSAAIARLERATVKAESAKQNRLISGFFFAFKQTTFARAAVLLVLASASLSLIYLLGDDSIRIEDELGKSALNAEFGHNEKPVSLSMMRKRHKIGEITVGQGSKLRVVKASNGDAFRSEVAFAGNEADFKLKYKGKASVVVKNGPFQAKVRIPQGAGNDVHLRFKEVGSLLPVGEPQFTIEVIKGDVQIAEVDDDDDFEQYKAGEKAIFSLSDSESL